MADATSILDFSSLNQDAVVSVGLAYVRRITVISVL